MWRTCGFITLVGEPRVDSTSRLIVRPKKNLLFVDRNIRNSCERIPSLPRARLLLCTRESHLLRKGSELALSTFASPNERIAPCPATSIANNKRTAKDINNNTNNNNNNIDNDEHSKPKLDH